MRFRHFAVLPAFLLLAACGDGSATTTQPDATTQSQTSASTNPTTRPFSETTASPTTPEMSPRGNYIAAIGKEIGAGDTRLKEPAVTWIITDIEVDPACELSISKPSEDGHIIIASIEAETREGFDEDVTLPGGFHPENNWSVADADGYVETRPTSEASRYCIDAEWPSEMVPASKYRFRVAFESPTPSGVLQYRASNWANGWEWQFG